MIDRDGYRPNVGIVLCNWKNEVFWGKRVREHSWQFPQGGIKGGERPEAAMYRELHEEVGLKPEHVEVLGRTRDWLRYEVPERWLRREWRGPYYSTEKGRWFSHRGELDQWYKDNGAFPMLDSDLKNVGDQVQVAANDARREEKELEKVKAAGEIIGDDLDPGIEPGNE